MGFRQNLKKLHKTPAEDLQSNFVVEFVPATL